MPMSAEEFAASIEQQTIADAALVQAIGLRNH
jgi:hypothetical protein